MHAIRIQAFGPLRIWLNGEQVLDSTWPTKKSRQLFEILLINHGRMVTAERLMDYLWPDLGVKQARNNLWVSISQARRVFEPDLASRAPSDYIHKRGEGYVLEPAKGYWIDFDAFQKAIRQAKTEAGTNERIAYLQQAVDLYQGDLCADDPYSEWTIQPRRRLRELFLDALADLATAHAKQGEFRRAANLCRYSLSFDDGREVNYRALMLYLYCAGERSAAVHVYEEVRQKLLEEIGVEPAAETEDLLQQIQNRQVIGVDIERQLPPHDSSQAEIFMLSQLPLVGRTRELRKLTDLIIQLQNGRSAVGLIAGESGIGKSRLLQETVEKARQEKMIVLLASCYQVEQNLLYEPLIDLLRQAHQAQPGLMDKLASYWQQELVLLIPEVFKFSRPASGFYDEITADRQGRLFQALLQYLSMLAADGGVILVIEDIHWADDGTLQFLHYLGSRINEIGMLLLLSYRQEDAGAEQQLANVLHHIRRLHATTTVLLNRLSKSDLDTLLHSQSIFPESWVNWLYNETIGNPFFVVSILQSLYERQVIPEDLTAQSLPPQDMSLPQTIRESVRDRLRQLETREIVILEWIAVYGRPLDFQDLKEFTDHTEGDLLEIVERLLRRDFLLEGTEGIQFPHHKIREAVYDDLSTIRKRVSHRRIGQFLTETGKDLPALLAYHFEQAGEIELALGSWLQAGQSALESYALQLAAAHFEKALTLAVDAADRLDAYEGLGQALTILDEIGHAETVLQTGITLSEETGDEWRRARLSFRYAQLVSRQHPSSAGESEMKKALALAENVNDKSLIARIQLLLSVAQVSKGMISDALATVLQARTISQSINEKQLEAETLNELGFLYAQLGQFRKSIEAVQIALSIQSEFSEPAIATYSWNILGRAYGGCGEYQQAIDAFTKCRQQATNLNDRFFIAQVPNMLGWLYRELYAFEDAEQYDQESAEIAIQYGKRPIEISARLNLCLDWLAMGRQEEAYTALKQINQEVKAGQFGFHQWRWQLRITHIFGLYYLMTEQTEFALAKAEELWDLAYKADAKKYLSLAQQLRGEASIKVGRREEAVTSLEMALKLADDISYKPVLWEARHQLAGLQKDKAQSLLADASKLIRATAGQLIDLALQQRFLGAPQIHSILAAQLRNGN